MEIFEVFPTVSLRGIWHRTTIFGSESDQKVAKIAANCCKRDFPLCSGGDLNPHAFRHTPLKRTCLPFHHPSDSEERNLYHGQCSSQVFRCGVTLSGEARAGSPGSDGASPYQELRPAYDGGMTAILIPFRAQACSSTFGQSSSANSSVTISFTLILPLSR